MFRKNYLPKLEIKKSSKTGKWFAYQPDSMWDTNFVEYDSGYSLTACSDPTEYDTLDDLIKAVYDYTRILHTEAIHKDLTYKSVTVKL